MVGDRDELLAIQRAYGVVRSFVFCLDEPDRHPSFTRGERPHARARAARRRTSSSPSPGSTWTRTPSRRRRAASTSAPAASSSTRARSASFPTTRASSPSSRSPPSGDVPILIHGGRGLPPIADSLAGCSTATAPPALIIAHAGIVDLAAMARNFAGRPGVFFDTSVWSPLDLLDLYRLVPPEQVVYASDYPYGRQPNALLMAIRTARASGLDEAQLRAVLHDTAARIADGLDPVTPGAPRGATELTQPVTFLRIHQYLTMATAMLWMRQPSDTFGMLGLALNACDERSNGYRRADGADPRAARRDARPLGALRRHRGRRRAAGVHSAARSASPTSRPSSPSRRSA